MKTTPFLLLLFLLTACSLSSCVCQKGGTDCDCNDKEATTTTFTADLSIDDAASVKDIAVWVFDRSGKLCGSVVKEGDALKAPYDLSVNTYIGTDYTVCATANAQAYGVTPGEVTSIVRYRTLFSSVLSKSGQEDHTTPILSGEIDNVSILPSGQTRVHIQMKDIPQ